MFQTAIFARATGGFTTGTPSPAGSIREIHYAESRGESTTTSSSDQDKVTLTFTPTASSDYFILGCAQCITNSITADWRCKLVNTTAATTYNQVNTEPSEANDEYVSFMGIGKETIGGSPSSTTWKIQYSDENGNTTKIKQAAILAIKAGANDQYAESLGSTATTNPMNVYATKVTLNFTPPTTGNYTFFWCCEMNTADTDFPPFNAKLVIDGTDYDENIRKSKETTAWETMGGMIPGVNLTNSSKTITLQFRGNGGSLDICNIRNAKILALREDDFSVAQTVLQRTRQTLTSSTYGDVASSSITYSTAAAEHILFGHCLLDNNSTSVSGYAQLLEDSTTLVESIEEPSATADRVCVFTIYSTTYSASSKTWKWQHRNEAAGTVGTDELAIALFQTG